MLPLFKQMHWREEPAFALRQRFGYGKSTLSNIQVDCVRRSPPVRTVRPANLVRGEGRLRSETELRRAKVEPERIELSSREDNIVPSTCLVDFNCREQKAGNSLTYSLVTVS